ncbi:hypothetical protein TWF694_002837 [Orbilia ellipsospora]|uniref:Uncharacterized protein n=1 Tax=Orbilia ellipsospora TaxID=2528407 RepID=A0AAV9WZT0_9PEZI
MVSFKAISAALAVAAVAQPVLATSSYVDFSDNYVSPGQIKPLSNSYGYRFDCFDLLGGVLDFTGNLIEDVLATLGAILGGKKVKYGHPVGIIGGVGNHYKGPSRIYHSTGKPFQVLSLKALCCAADLSKKCNILDCRINLSGYDKQSGGNKIYDHDFYVPKSYNQGNKDVAPIDIDVTTDGILKLGVIGLDLNSVIVKVDLLDVLDVDVNTKPHGHYSYPPLRSHQTTGVSAILDLNLALNVDAKVSL